MRKDTYVCDACGIEVDIDILSKLYMRMDNSYHWSSDYKWKYYEKGLQHLCQYCHDSFEEWKEDRRKWRESSPLSGLYQH